MIHVPSPLRLSQPRTLSSLPKTLSCFTVVVGLLASTSPACGQLRTTSSGADTARLGEAEVRQFRVGAEIDAKRGACRNVLAIVAIPVECDEQRVRVVSQDISPAVKDLQYRDLPGGKVRQMLIHVPYLQNQAKAHAYVIFEVTTRCVLTPESTEQLVIPKRPPRELRPFLGTSPYIEVRHRKIRDLSRSILSEVDESAPAWQQVEAIYDYVRTHVKYVEGPDKSAVDTIEDGEGDCQNVSATFIALCRAAKIPARMVWVENHAYPEFYLEDADGKGHWFPCQSTGDRAFGHMPDPRIILQKGDNFRMPERPQDKMRYASDWARGLPTRGGGKPHVNFVRERP